MSVYRTEEEQIEAIKGWWKKHSNLITVVLSIVLLVIAGYRYWDWHEKKVLVQASGAYEQMMLAYANHDNKSVKAFANQLISNNKGTVYADAAHLTLSKLYVDKDRLDSARDELQSVAEQSKVPAIRQIAKLRLARVLIAQKAYKEALTELSAVIDQSYMPIINELRGDIYTATGKFKQASAAYQMAMQGAEKGGTSNLFLEMKSNEIAGLATLKVSLA